MLLSPKFRIAGGVTTFMGILLYIVKFPLGINFSFLDTKVFAIYSLYLSPKYFTVIDNNIFDEIIGLMLVIGLMLLTCSKLKDESESKNSMRLKAFILSIYINTVLLALGFCFFYGIAFVQVLIVQTVSQLLIYNIIFCILFVKQRNSIQD